jgi:DNA polymerase-3 subunit alpha
MPDIDIDFDDEGRDKVMDYVINKYGREKVAQIVTFGTMAAKSSIRDVARVLKLPLPEADRLAKLVPEKPGTTLSQAYKDIPELTKALQDPNPLIVETLKYAKILEGSTRQTGVHACGVIIGPKNLVECLPLSTQKDTDLPVTQYDGKYVENVGMLKMDFLGLKTLSILKDAVKNIKATTGNEINIEKIPLDDEATFNLYQKGDTIGTFQFESAGMREYLKELKPNNIEDLIAMNALYRPGPMEFIPLYIDRKHGRKKTEYPHPWLVEILKPTYGIMVYQEQIMQAAQIMAGYSLGSADILRRAMGKKIKSAMAEQKVHFVDGAIKKGIEKKQAEKIFDTMARFAEYGFNRSHSAAYSVLAYQTAYLKANYPAEYMASVLTNNLSDIKKIAQMMEECQRQKIPALGPDINESGFKFAVNKKGEIRFGLGAVKGIGEGAVEAIVSEREKNGPYQNIFDFSKRVNLRSVNKRVFESLAKAGAFDSFEGTHRAQFFYSDDGGQHTFIDKIIRHANLVAQRENSSQISLFDDTDEISIPDPEMPICQPWDKLEAIRQEKEVTGMYIMGHPLDDYQIEMKASCTVSISDLNNGIQAYKNREVTFAGIITEANHRVGKTGKPWVSFTMEDYTDSIQLAVFGEDYLKLKHLIEPQTLVHINCRIQEKFNSNVLEPRVKNISLLSEIAEKTMPDLLLFLPLEKINELLVKKITELSRLHKGKSKLKIAIIDSTQNISLEMLSRKATINSVAFLKDILKEFELPYRLN